MSGSNMRLAGGNMRHLLRRYRESDPAVRSSLEVLLLYPGVKALILHRLSSYLWRKGLSFLARAIAEHGRFATGIEIHPGAKIGRGLVIDHGMGIVIGETAEIGDDCLLYHGVTLGATKNLKAKRHPTLGARVVVGAGAKILGDITIGEGARIGANAVVVKDVPPGATALGIPARLVIENEPS
jgi:serine O-acetyltransferase